MPTMTGLITIQSSLLKLFLDGPNGQILLKISVDNCRDNWPSMLFFTFNFMKDAKVLQLLFFPANNNVL